MLSVALTPQFHAWVFPVNLPASITAKILQYGKSFTFKFAGKFSVLSFESTFDHREDARPWNWGVSFILCTVSLQHLFTV